MVITKDGNNNVKNFVSENSETNTLKMLLKRLNERLRIFLTVSSRLFFPVFIGQKQR